MLREVVTFSSIVSKREGNRRVTPALAQRVFLEAISSELDIGKQSVRLHSRQLFLDNMLETEDDVYIHVSHDRVSVVDAAEEPKKRTDCSVPSAKCNAVLSSLPHEAFIALRNDRCRTTSASISHLRCGRYIDNVLVWQYSTNALCGGTSLSPRHTERRSLMEICQLWRSRRRTVAFL